MQKINLHPIRRFLYFYIPLHMMLYYIILFGVSDSLGKTIITNILSFIGPVTSAFLLFFAIQRTSSKEKVFWKFLFIGILFSIVGEFFWYYNNITLLKEPPFPSISDVFYLLNYNIILWALVFTVSFYNRKTRTLITILDIFIIITVVLTICWELIYKPFYLSSHSSFPEIFMMISYPLTELLIFFGLIHITFLLNEHFLSKTTLKLLLYSFGIYFFVEVIFLYYTAIGFPLTQKITEPLWTLFMFTIGFSSLYTNHSTKIKENETRLQKLMRGNFLPLSSIGVLITVLVYSIKDFNILMIGAFICFILLFTRQLLTLKENKQLNQLLSIALDSLEQKNKQLKETVFQLEELNKIREHEAKTDFLTGLYNRRYIDELIVQLILKAETERSPFSLLIIDVDLFKSVNDRYGHDVGDEVLMKLAKIFKKSIRSSDIVGRFGGEEFVIVLPDSDLEDGKILAERIRHTIAQNKIECAGYHIPLTVSIGCTTWCKNDTFNELYKRVDGALYEAKRNRDTIIVR
ncbi:GGDEF domain-containing protein [Bacillus kwashiorkori]|uniref:GGDEF domain-containing protein n=1 Tax=Bacillus kwashiorkori TaxID=1522318 RepID=UPI0007826972|nr:GGDEF domain-containing protein [Bacillus kwashiorkori]